MVQRLIHTAFLSFLCLLTLHEATATHIVGGELERRYLGPVPQGSLYELSLILYFDIVNGNPGAEDPFVEVGIFERGTNAFVRSVQLPRVSRTLVNYTNPACALASLATRRIQYSKAEVLENSIFNSTNGYYMVWDRCCRNGSIANINLPGSTGQLFYMEFPPLVFNGSPFVNSSPRLFPPISDYACVNQLFEFNIAGQDDDQDSLVYSSVVPLAGNGSTVQPLPFLQAAPYPLVSWNTAIGASATAMIPGNPAFQVTAQGLISFSPSLQGLFVFGVRCEEFRNGVKIGEVRRDFQILVIGCAVNQPPVIRSVGMNVAQSSGDTLVLDTVRTCFSLWVSDAELNSSLNILLEPLPGYPLLIDNPSITTNLGAQDSVEVVFCLNSCNPSDTVLLLRALLSDNGCPFPKSDSKILRIPVVPTKKQKPELNASIPDGIPLPINIRTPFNFTVNVSDADNDLILLLAYFEGESAGTTSLFVTPTLRIAPFTANVTWTPNCSVLAKDSLVLVVVAANQECDFLTDTIRFVLIPEFPNLPPVLERIEPLGAPEDSIFKAQQDALFQLVYRITDPDKDPVLGAITALTAPLPAGMQLVTRRFGDSVLLAARWTPSCSDQRTGPISLRFDAIEQSCVSRTSARSAQIIPIDEVEAFIPPNVITPNGDGKNDFFAINYLPEQCLFKGIKIFNRWGRVIFESSSDTFVWSGELVSGGHYYYLAEYEQKTIKGFVYLMK